MGRTIVLVRRRGRGGVEVCGWEIYRRWSRVDILIWVSIGILDKEEVVVDASIGEKEVFCSIRKSEIG